MVTGAHVGCRLRMRRSSVYDDDIMQYLVPCLWEESGDETKPPLAFQLLWNFPTCQRPQTRLQYFMLSSTTNNNNCNSTEHNKTLGRPCNMPGLELVKSSLLYLLCVSICVACESSRLYS